MSWWNKKPFSVGLELGQDQAKFVCVAHHGKGDYRLDAMGILNPLSSAFQKLVETLSLGSIRVNIDDSSLKVRRLDLPQMPGKEVPTAIKYGFKKLMEDPVDAYEFRFEKMSLSAGLKTPYLVYAIRREAIKKRLEMIRSVGLGKIDVLEPNVSALSMTFRNCFSDGGDQPIVLVDMGGAQATFMILERGELLFARPMIRLSTRSLVSQICRDFGISESEARVRIHHFEQQGWQSGDDRLKNSVCIFFSSGALDIKRSIESFLSTFQREQVGHVFLVGEMSYLPGLVKWFSSAIDLPVSLFDPFRRIRVSKNILGNLESKKRLFGVACGLAMEDVDGTH